MRQVIARGGSFWASTKLKHLPKLEHLLQSCFKQAGSARPPTLTISATLFDIWSELKNGEGPSNTVDDQDSEQVITQTKERAFALIYQARPGKGKKATARMDQVPGKDVELIHHHSGIDPYHSTDPGCTFLLGAIAWYQLLPPDWVQVFDIADGSKYAMIYYNASTHSFKYHCTHSKQCAGPDSQSRDCLRRL